VKVDESASARIDSKRASRQPAALPQAPALIMRWSAAFQRYERPKGEFAGLNDLAANEVGVDAGLVVLLEVPLDWVPRKYHEILNFQFGNSW